MPLDQQNRARIRQEDSGAGHEFPIDGEHPTIPSRDPQIRGSGRRNLPNGGSLRKEEHFPGHSLLIRFGQNRKYFSSSLRRVS